MPGIGGHLPMSRQASFETAARRLADIVDQLEGEELSLEKAVALFEEGIRVNRQAQARLNEAEKRVKELLAVDARGEAQTQPFETGTSERGAGAGG